MTEVQTKTRRVVDEEGTVLFLETSEVLTDGDDVRTNLERQRLSAVI